MPTSSAMRRIALLKARRCVTPYAHNQQTRSLHLFLYEAMNLCAYLVLDLRAHGQSIQNLGCHIRSATYFFTRRLSTIIPSSGLTCRELNTSIVYVSFIAFTLKRTIQPAQVVEALNDFDTPRYLLTNTHGTIQLLAEVNRPNLKYRYDIYHMQRMEGNLIATLHQHIGQIEHIQVADPPGRHGPGTGEIHYLNVLAALDVLGYQGYVGLEYNPTTSSEASFAWLPGDRSGMLAVSDLRL